MNNKTKENKLKIFINRKIVFTIFYKFGILYIILYIYSLPTKVI